MVETGSDIENDTVMEEQQRGKSSVLAVNLALAANVFLAAIKTLVGITGHSPALLADGVNSTSDVVYNLVVAVFMRFSRKPADREHPFGHSQLESIAALIVGAFVITTAVGIFWDSINAVFDQLTGEVSAQAASTLALWIALLTIVLKFVLFKYTTAIGKRTRNIAVSALAYDHRNDIFSSGAALTGIVLSRFGFTWVDPLAGAVVSLVILRTGIQILRESTDDLMDTIPGEELETQVKGTLHEIPGIRQVEDISAHRFGPYLTMNITLGVDGMISVAQGDQIATAAEQALRASIPYLKVVQIHYHPA